MDKPAFIEKIIKAIPVEKLGERLPLDDWASLERISGQRVTVEAQSNNHTIKMCGLDAKAFASDAELFIKSQLLLSAYYGFDKPCIDYDLYNIESEALGQRLIYADGSLPEVDFKHPLLLEKKTLSRLVCPVQAKNNRFAYVRALNKLFQSILGFSPRLRFCGPFSIAVNLRGYGRLIQDMEDDRAFVKDLFDFLTYEVIIPWVKIQRQDMKDPKALAAGIEATVTFPNISHAIMRDWIMPYYDKAKEVLGNVTFTVCCGGISYFQDPKDFFDYQLYSSPGTIKGYQWDIDAVGFKVFNDYAKKNNLKLRLGISAPTLLRLHEAGAIELARDYIRQGASGLKGYSIYLSDIDAQTDPKIIRCLVDAVKQLGIYPVEKNVNRDFFAPDPDPIDFNDWISNLIY